MEELAELSKIRELEEENQSYREMLNEYQTRDASSQVNYNFLKKSLIFILILVRCFVDVKKMFG